MNIYSKDYNIYLSSQLRGVSEDKLANPLVVDWLWNTLCDTVRRIEVYNLNF